MSTTVFSWNGIEDEKLKTEFSIVQNNVVKNYTVSYNTELVINMSLQGVEAHLSNPNEVNAQGWTRNKNYYWEQLLKAHPEYFSQSNTYKIQQLGLAPIVDKTFIQYFSEYAQFQGDKLLHHHIGQDGQAVAVPRTMHLGGLAGVHEAEMSLGITANAELASLKCQEVWDIVGLSIE